MTRYYKREYMAIFGPVLEKFDVSNFDRNNENYLVIGQGEYGLIVKNGLVTELLTKGTYDLNDYDFDGVYSLTNAEETSLSENINQPITCKLANGKLITFTCNLFCGYKLIDGYRNILQFFGEERLSNDDYFHTMKKMFKQYMKEAFKEFDGDPENYIGWNIAPVVKRAAQLMSNEVKDYGVSFEGCVSVDCVEVNEPWMFNNDTYYEDDEKKPEPSPKSSSSNATSNNAADNILGSLFKASIKDSLTGTNENLKREEKKLTDNIVDSIFDSFFGKK